MNILAIIVPLYNAENYLKRCLDSIFNQTYKDYFVICVNDGSTDSSSTILNSYKNIYKNIEIIETKNFGPSHARNVGLDFIFLNIEQFKYITFVDSDDYLENDYLETLYNLISKNKCDIVCSSYVLAKTNSSRTIKHSDFEGIKNNIETLNQLLEDRSIQSHSPEKLFKIECFENVRYPEDIVSMEDQGTIYKTFIKSKNVYITNYAGYYYWQDSNSVCRTKMTNKKVIDSLKGYLAAVLDKSLPKQCYQSAVNGYSNCYLMMYPRFDKKAATNAECNEFRKLTTFTNKNKIISIFIPITKKEKVKKLTYLYLRCLYRFLFIKYIGKENI